MPMNRREMSCHHRGALAAAAAVPLLSGGEGEGAAEAAAAPRSQRRGRSTPSAISAGPYGSRSGERRRCVHRRPAAPHHEVRRRRLPQLHVPLRDGPQRALHAARRAVEELRGAALQPSTHGTHVTHL
uniref:MelC1 n=1 Tax=Streptomyces griseus TaxID=1911 RepID=Q9ZN73_STRGR|nr:MelC1 [Streptomyces griseus] [Streptomyces griseus subsp. griseus NBRC 13350]